MSSEDKEDTETAEVIENKIDNNRLNEKHENLSEKKYKIQFWTDLHKLFKREIKKAYKIWSTWFLNYIIRFINTCVLRMSSAFNYN